MKKIFVFCLSLLVVTNLNAQFITTIAGGGFLASGVPGTQAQLNRPCALVVDPNGNLYFTDTGHSIVRKISSTGILTTYAGTGSIGYSGDGGLATAAMFYGPIGIARDNFGNTYIGDYNMCVVRKISSSGIITTIAGSGSAGSSGDGGPATLAKLNGPQGLACDATGNLYIADYNNNKIRKVSTSGIISTYAGTGVASYSGDGGAATAATLKNPIELAFDASGNLFISDAYNFRIRKVDASGVISSVANSYQLGRIPVGLAIDPNNNDVFFTDYISSRLFKLPSSGGTAIVVAGSGTSGFSGDGGSALSAKLNHPLGIKVLANGVIYIADSDNNRVRKIDAQGIITTIAGMSNNVAAIATTMQMSPYYVTQDPNNGEVYIGDYFKNIIYKMNPGTGVMIPFAGNGSGGFSGDNGAATSAQIDSVSGIIKTPNGLLICDKGNRRIRFVDNAGIITTIAGTGVFSSTGDGGAATQATFKEPAAIAYHNGNIFVSDIGAFKIRKIDQNGIITTYVGTGSPGNTGDGGLASSATLGLIEGMTCDTFGNLYIADRYFHTIRKISTNGIITRIAGNGIAGYAGDGGFASSSQLDTPMGITCDLAGNLYFSDYYNYRIRKINSGGLINTICGTGTLGFSGDNGPALLAQINGVLGLHVSPSGNSLFIADGGNNRLRLYSDLNVPEICMVTVDSTKNLIYYDKAAFFNTDSIIVYREINSNPVTYMRVGGLAYNDLSVFSDTNRVWFTANALPNGDPDISTYRYKIQLKSTDNNYSLLSKYHNSIYVSNNNNGNFTWNTYDIEGVGSPVSTYELLRDDLGTGNYQLVGTTSGSQTNLTDPNYSLYQTTANWKVEAQGFNCNPTARFDNQQNQYLATITKTRSNIKNNRMVGIQQMQSSLQLNAYPNPVQEELIIEIPTSYKENNYKIIIVDIVGNVVLENNLSNGLNTLDLSRLSQGSYVLKVTSIEGFYISKILKQ